MLIILIFSVLFQIAVRLSSLFFLSNILQFEFIFHTSVFFALYEVQYLLFYRTYKSYLSYHEVEFRLN